MLVSHFTDEETRPKATPSIWQSQDLNPNPLYSSYASCHLCCLLLRGDTVEGSLFLSVLLFFFIHLTLMHMSQKAGLHRWRRERHDSFCFSTKSKHSSQEQRAKGGAETVTKKESVRVLLSRFVLTSQPPQGPAQHHIRRRGRLKVGKSGFQCPMMPLLCPSWHCMG